MKLLGCSTALFPPETNKSRENVGRHNLRTLKVRPTFFSKTND